MEQGSQGFVLVGGIGAGKSYVGAIMASRGVAIIEADRVGHDVLEPGGECFEQVKQRWPAVVVDGRIDRRALGRLVFEDRAQLRELESITHPAIAREIRRQMAAHASLVGIERPMLSGIVGEGLPVVVVDAPTDVRINRLLERGMSSAEISQRMAAQPTREEWLTAADFVINNAPGANLHIQVDAALEFVASADFVIGSE